MSLALVAVEPAIARWVRARKLADIASLAVLAFAVLLFRAAHHAHPAKPTAGVLTNGWWSGWDQGHYLRAAQAIARLDLSPAAQHYEPGYPALGAPFVGLTPGDPFLIPDVAALLLACWLFGGIGARLLGERVLGGRSWARPVSMALFVLTTVGYAPAAATWVVPWTTTPVAPLLFGALLASLGFFDRPRPWPCFLAALSSCAIAAFRPGDIGIVAIPCASLILFVLVRHWPGRRRAIMIVLAGMLGAGCALGSVVILHAAIWGLKPSPYMLASRAAGFELRLLPLRWVLIVVGPHPLTQGRGLVAVFPWIIPGIVGMLTCLAVPGREGRLPHVLIGAVAALSLVMFLTYRDLHPGGIWRYGNVHYFKWLLPLTALYALALALVRALATSGRRVPALLIGISATVALFCWRPELRLVPPGAIPATVEAPHRLTLANGLPNMSDGLLIAADGSSWEKLYLGAYDARGPGSLFHATTGFKAYPRLGGFLLIPLRPITPETTFVFPDSVNLDPAIAPIPVRQTLVFAPPCWLVSCTDPDLIPRPQFPLGRPVALDSGLASRDVGEGWDDPEPGGRWTIAERASLSVNASGLPSGQDVIVTLIGTAYDPQGQDPAHVLLQANGHSVADWHVAPGPEARLVALVPAADIGPGGDLRLTLVIPHPRSPVQYEQNLDFRPLGLFVHTIEVAPAGEDR